MFYGILYACVNSGAQAVSPNGNGLGTRLAYSIIGSIDVRRRVLAEIEILSISHAQGAVRDVT